MAITRGTTVPLILDLVFLVVEVWPIGLQLKADVVARIKHHGRGERHGHLPGAPIQVEVASGADVHVHAARRIVIIAILSFHRSSPMSWSPGRRTASPTFDDDRWRRTASNRYPDTDIGLRPSVAHPANIKAPSPVSSSLFIKSPYPCDVVSGSRPEPSRRFSLGGTGRNTIGSVEQA